MNQEYFERLVDKSDRQLFINDLNTGFGLSKVEAEALYDRITLFNRDYYDGSRGPCQITKTVVALGEPAGKPIKYCRMVSVNLTIYHEEELEIRQEHGIAAERRNKELRLCDEAIEQGGVLTQEDLAFLLGTSLSTIKRDDAYLRKQGIALLTRGMVEDIGRGVSHTIRKITKLSERLIKEYISLIERAESEGYSDRHNQLLDRFKVNEPFKKTSKEGA